MRVGQFGVRHGVLKSPKPGHRRRFDRSGPVFLEWQKRPIKHGADLSPKHATPLDNVSPEDPLVGCDVRNFHTLPRKYHNIFRPFFPGSDSIFGEGTISTALSCSWFKTETRK